ncbi:uncharacterized protein [Diadema antillarum]|uniref:uncharacterized protein n=1 Tax=Diadema antillarum TaxID=105358 RepID=UPI003A86F830
MEGSEDTENHERDLNSSEAGAEVAMVIDTSWIKEEPQDSEDDGSEEDGFVPAQASPSSYNDSRYSLSPEEEEEEGELLLVRSKRKRKVNEDDPDYVEPPPKIITVRLKQEPQEEFVDTAQAIDPQQLLREHVKREIRNKIKRDLQAQYSTDEEEGDENVEGEGVNSSRAMAYQRKNMQKCSQCMKIFHQTAKSLPQALQGLCSMCRPSVSFTCKYCKDTFNHHKAYSKHVRKCLDSVRCRHCRVIFPSAKKLIQHACQEQLAERLLKYVCPMCCQVFDKNKTRNMHKTLHVTEEPKICHHCNINFPDVASYQAHREGIGDSLHFVCLICETFFMSKALYEQDKKRHHLQLGERHKIKPAPDFVYVCTTCKFWFKTLFRFNRHKCKEDYRESIEGKKKKIEDPVHLQELRSMRNERGSNLPAVTENVLNTSFTCQLCSKSFWNASALGYHKCLVNKHAYEDWSDSEEEQEEKEEEEEENEGERTGAGSLQDKPDATEGGRVEDTGHSGSRANDDSNILIKLVTNQVLSYYEVRKRPEPGRGTALPAPPVTSSLETFRKELCGMCARVVQHDFPKEVCEKSRSYLCSVCLQKVGQFPSCRFKCSKCPQVFPSLERLTLHLPWHKKERGLQRRTFPFSSFTNSISPPTSVSPPVSSIQSVSSGVDKEEICTRPVSSAKKQLVTNSSDPLLTSLLDKPSALVLSTKGVVTQRDSVTDLPTPTVAAKGKPQEVKVQQPEFCQVINQQMQPCSSASIVNPLPGALPRHLAVAPGQQNLPPVVNANQAMNPVVMLRRVAPHPVISSVPAGQNSTAYLIPVGNQQSHASPIQFSVARNPSLKSGMLVQVVPKPQNLQTLPVQGLAPASNTLNAGLQNQQFSNVQKNVLPQRRVNIPMRPTQQALTESSNANAALKEQHVSSGKCSAGTTNPSNMKICSITQTGSSTAEVTLTAETIAENRSVPFGEGSTPEVQTTVQSLGAVSGDGKPHPGGLFLCYGCNRLFKDITALRSHGCKIQAFRSDTRTAVFLPQEQIHTQKCPMESYVCHMCQKSCTSAEELNQHECIESNDIRIKLEDDSAKSVRASSDLHGPPSASMPDLSDEESFTTGAAETEDGAEGEESQRGPGTRFHGTGPKEGALALHSHKKMHQLRGQRKSQM